MKSEEVAIANEDCFSEMCFGRERILDWEHFFNDRSLSVLTGCDPEVSEEKKKSQKRK